MELEAVKCCIQEDYPQRLSQAEANLGHESHTSPLAELKMGGLVDRGRGKRDPRRIRVSCGNMPFPLEGQRGPALRSWCAGQRSLLSRILAAQDGHEDEPVTLPSREEPVLGLQQFWNTLLSWQQLLSPDMAPSGEYKTETEKTSKVDLSSTGD